MEGSLEGEIDRSVITDNILLEIIPISDEKFGGSRETALENAKKAYVNFKTIYKKHEGKTFNETVFARMFSNPISAKATASLVRTVYYSTNNLTDSLIKEAEIFSETSELMHLYHEHLAGEKLNENDGILMNRFCSICNITFSLPFPCFFEEQKQPKRL